MFGLAKVASLEMPIDDAAVPLSPVRCGAARSGVHLCERPPRPPSIRLRTPKIEKRPSAIVPAD